MNQTVGDEENGPGIDVLGLLRAHGRVVTIVAVVVAAMAAVAGGVYLRWGQPTHVVASLEFRPTFIGMDEMRYPNRLPFSANDVTAGQIVDLVYDRNNITVHCDRDSFRAGFFVEQRSDQSVFLDLEYQARLTEPRITAVERKLLQEEHAAKRKALPLQFRLVFVTPPPCSSLPAVVISKVMVDVLATWASESETKRGVLNHQVEVLTPSALDVAVAGPGGLLLRADLLRTGLERVIRNVEEVSRLPGAVLVRLGPERVTFMEVRGKLFDLVGSRLDPLVMTSGRSMVRESAVWVNEVVAQAERKERAAQERAAAYQSALREFSGTVEAASSGRTAVASTATSPNSNNPQALVPQIDGSFIDRIVEMSEATARFRQELTQSMVQWQLEAVGEEQRASYYRRLLQSVRELGAVDTPAQELEARFNEIVVEGKALTKQFGDLYDEFSRVALRSAGSMYETAKPVTIEISQRFSRRSLMTLVGVVFVATLLLALGFFVVRDRLSLESRWT